MKRMKISSTTKFITITLFLVLPMFLVNMPVTTHGYTECDGIQDGDKAVLEYKGTIKSSGEVFDENSDGFAFDITRQKLIQGFYENVLGMFIGEQKTFEVPPSKGYTNPETAPNPDLYDETLIFEVYVQRIASGVRDCDSGAGDGGFGQTLLNILGWVLGIAVVGFLGVTGYFSLQKSTTKSCVHCKNEGRDRLSEGKCGKCGEYYCRQSFSRGCPNCKSNAFVPNK